MVCLNSHKSLQGVQSLNRRQARWLEYMARFNYSWEYVSGSLNIADALSRHPNLYAAVLSVATRRQTAKAPTEVPPTEFAARLKDASVTDPYFTVKRNTANLTCSHGIWLRVLSDRRQIVVPNDDTLRQDILAKYHDGPLAGHPGCTRLIELVSRTFWWP